MLEQITMFTITCETFYQHDSGDENKNTEHKRL